MPTPAQSLRITGASSADAASGNAAPWWAVPAAALLERLGSSAVGLTSAEAAARLARDGANTLVEHRMLGRLGVLWEQIKSPLLLLLFFAAIASGVAGEWSDAAIVGAIVLVTVAVGYSREYKAQAAVAALKARIATRASVLRDGKPTPVPFDAVVPGDVVLLAAGSLVPADAALLEAVDCHVTESVLTGESFPVEKEPGAAPAGAPLSQRPGALFMGTNVRSGTAKAVIAATGTRTELGAIAERLALRAPETEFDRGVRRFGYLVTIAMLAMTLGVFAVHVISGRAPVETLLFAIALAVGLSPELLPAILSINLARSAEGMAKHGVLVRRLSAIENLGSIDVLCTDKTGTLTRGVVSVEGAWGPNGERSSEVLQLAALNAALEAGLSSPLDEAILAAQPAALDGLTKLAEVPFDFVHKRISVAVEGPKGVQLVTKGALAQVLEVCALDDGARAAALARAAAWSQSGMRVLGVATRAVPAAVTYRRADERDMTFAGFVTFLDQPKEGAALAVAALGRLGVAVKMITGDNRFVAQHVASLVGLAGGRVLTGEDLDRLTDPALWREAEQVQLFAEVDPNQKERIIRALRKSGHVVGFMGDGVNDAPAMHAADTSLSVDDAVDVAREAADFVLLESDLDVIRRGIEEGRKTFANTLKYLNITMSANLGNMVSMAVMSLFLPFLPLTAGQILLNNFLSDVPAAGIAGDSVDPELIERPRRWHMRSIAWFMVQFGLLSSLFDFATFGALLLLFGGAADLFHTGWFVESLLTELCVALLVRSRRPFFKSRPGRVLLWTTLALVPLTVAIPYLPYASVLGFVPMPPLLVLTLAGITVAYMLAVEVLKRWHWRARPHRPRPARAPG